MLFLFYTSIVFAQTEGSNAFTYKENNNQVIELQSNHANPTAMGNVKFEFYGWEAFKITSPQGVTILFDPWRNDLTGFWGKWYFGEFPQIPVDVVISTHAHFDHYAIHQPHAAMVLERPVGEFQLGDLKIIGLADKHQYASASHHKWDQISAFAHIETGPPNNPMGFDNAIQVLETGGLKIVIWGDNRPDVDPSLHEYFRKVITSS